MRKLIFIASLMVLGLISTSFAQASRPRPQTSDDQKANQRKPPATTPTPIIATGSQTSEKTAAQPVDSTAIEDGGVINVETSLVSVPFKVLDRDGRFVGGLKQEDFEVYENGAKQEVAFFGTEEQPFTVVLLLDVSLSTKFKIDEIQNAAIGFTKELRPKDKIMVMAFDGNVQVLCEPTNDRKLLEEGIKRAQFGGGTSLYEAVDFAMKKRLAKIEGRKAIVLFTDGVDTTSRKADYESTIADAEEDDALVYSLKYDTFADVQKIEQSGQIPGQTPTPGTTRNPLPFPTTMPNPNGGITLPSIGNLPPITLPNPRGNDSRYPRGSDGRYPPNNDPNRDPSASTNPNSLPNPTDDDGINGRRQPTRPVMGGSGDTREEYAIGAQYLREISSRTGGRLYNIDTLYSLGAAFTQIAQDLRQQYSLGYYPAEERKTGQTKKIKVKILRPKMAVQARESYIVGKKSTDKNEKLKKFSR